METKQDSKKVREWQMGRVAASCALLVSVFFCFVSTAVAAAAPVVLFDQAHDERFVIAKDEPLQLSGLAAVLKAEGLDVRSSVATLSDESLKGVDALVISGPFKPLDDAEVEAVVRFIERGGRLAVMLHIGPTLTNLLHRLKVAYANFVLYEQENVIDGDPKNFRVKVQQTSPLFAGIDHFSLYGGWGLISRVPSAKIIAATSPKAWVDLNGDNKLSPDEVVGSVGVIVAGELGAGRFVIFGDDAIFQNKFLDEQNKRLAANLARWFKK